MNKIERYVERLRAPRRQAIAGTIAGAVFAALTLSGYVLGRDAMLRLFQSADPTHVLQEQMLLSAVLICVFTLLLACFTGVFLGQAVMKWLGGSPRDQLIVALWDRVRRLEEREPPASDGALREAEAPVVHEEPRTK